MAATRAGIHTKRDAEPRLTQYTQVVQQGRARWAGAMLGQNGLECAQHRLGVTFASAIQLESWKQIGAIKALVESGIQNGLAIGLVL